MAEFQGQDMASATIETIGIDLPGRITSLKLPDRSMLLPLFEAIINSIHAIEEANVSDGQIEITIGRENTLSFDDTNIPSIIKFIITDNGVGFDDKNYQSFKKAHSTHKLEKGGKGIGRFTWLKAFSDVSISSVFSQDELFFKREFDFNMKSQSGIERMTKQETSEGKKTKVELNGFKDPYKNKCPKKLNTIANKIIEHCLIYFLKTDCPTIILKDSTDQISLNSRFSELTTNNKYIDSFKIRNFDFKLTLLKWFEHDEFTYHKISFCANHREVEDFNINKIFHDLNSKISDLEVGKDYLIVGYLESDYFDQNTNDERTKIDFARENLFDKELLNQSEIFVAVEPLIKKHFEEVIKDFQQRKRDLIVAYVTNKAPQYSLILKNEDSINNLSIPENSTDQEIDLRLYKVYQEIDFTSRKETLAILSNLSEDETPDDLRTQYDKAIHQLSELNKSKLVQYVVHRKYIIDLFEKSLALNLSGKYELEKTVHDIIFPTKKTSDDVDYSDQNLWLIDERLSFHTFLASDKPLNSIDGLETQSTTRPDLLIFNNPISYIEGEDSPFNSIVLFEFKRPMRENYTWEENPIEQIYEYIREIRAGNKIMKNGRPFPINENTRFYTYLVCDIDTKIDKWADNAQLNKTFDGLGYYGYHKSLKCMLEILTFDQLVTNAKKRNKILFHKLGV